MMKEKFRITLYAFTCLLTFLALTALIPFRAEAASLEYGGWELDGFLRNNTGVWTENWDYAPNNDPLATCRNWLRLNLNGKIIEGLRLKAEVLAVYEPDYARTHGGVFATGERIPANAYNYLDFRELRLDWKPVTGSDIRIGKQIVNWGESISARVGDVINPVDNRFDLGFTNLEDTRIPIYMVRWIQEISSIGTSIDMIFSPYMGPDRYRVTRQPSNLGLVNIDGTYKSGERFAAYPLTPAEMFNYYGTSAPILYDARWMGYGIIPANMAIPAILGASTLPVIGAPFDRMWTYRAENWGGGGEPAGLYWTGIPNPDTSSDYPDSSLKDSRYGFKTSSTLAGWQTGVYFWSSNEMDGTFKIRGSTVIAPDLTLYDIGVQFPRQNVYGWFANKNFDIGVLRLDAAYRPNRQHNTLDRTVATGIVEKDKLMVQVGFNKDVMWRALNPTATFSFIAEYVGDYFLQNKDQACVPSYFIELPKDLHTLFISGGTNYNFGMYAYSVTLIYNSEKCGLIQPSFTYSPTWMNNKWQFKLAYSSIFGPAYSYPYGLMNEKDNVILTTQYTFP